jgi:hypothetical protein
MAWYKHALVVGMVQVKAIPFFFFTSLAINSKHFISVVSEEVHYFKSITNEQIDDK